jgi:hypothetical protein
MIIIQLSLPAWNFLYCYNWIWCPGHLECLKWPDLYGIISWGYLVQGLDRPATPYEAYERTIRGV